MFFLFFFGLLHVLLYVFWFCHLTGISFLHMILHGWMFGCFCFCSCLVYMLWGLWVIFWWGVLFFCLCTTTYVCISYDPYNVYPFTFLFFPLMLYFVFLFLSTHCPWFYFFSIVCMLSMIG